MAHSYIRPENENENLPFRNTQLHQSEENQNLTFRSNHIQSFFPNAFQLVAPALSIFTATHLVWRLASWKALLLQR